MSIVPAELFLHIIGVVAMFAGYSALLFGVAALLQARDVSQVRAITGTLFRTRRVGIERISAIDVLVIAGVVLIAVPGLHLALQLDVLRAPWIDVAIGTFALLAPLGPFVVNPRLHRIGDLAETAAVGPVPGPLRDAIHDRTLIVTLGVSVSALVGIVLLMTIKVELIASLVGMLITTGAGLVLTLWTARDRGPIG